MNQDALKILAKELTGEQFKVLMLMLADLDYENFIQIAQADIADALEMQKTHVSRAVRALLLRHAAGREEHRPPADCGRVHHAGALHRVQRYAQRQSAARYDQLPAQLRAVARIHRRRSQEYLLRRRQYHEYGTTSGLRLCGGL